MAKDEKSTFEMKLSAIWGRLGFFIGFSIVSNLSLSSRLSMESLTQRDKEENTDLSFFINLIFNQASSQLQYST